MKYSHKITLLHKKDENGKYTATEEAYLKDIKYLADCTIAYKYSSKRSMIPTATIAIHKDIAVYLSNTALTMEQFRGNFGLPAYPIKSWEEINDMIVQRYKELELI